MKNRSRSLPDCALIASLCLLIELYRIYRKELILLSNLCLLISGARVVTSVSEITIVLATQYRNIVSTFLIVLC